MSKEQRRYVSVREQVEKDKRGFTATILKVPKNTEMFKPKVGRYLLDILPYPIPGEKGLYGYTYRFWVHYKVGANEQAYVCPRKTVGKPCPICEHAQKLMRRLDSDDDQVKACTPKERQLFNLIDRKNPDKGVQLFEFSFHNFGKMLQNDALEGDEDDGWENFFADKGGSTLKVSFVEESMGKGRPFLQAGRIDFREREDVDPEVLEQVHVLEDLVIIPDYDDLKEKFFELEDEEDEEGDTDHDEPRSKRRQSDEEDEEEPRKKRKSDEEDEEEEQPRGKKKRDEEDEEEEEPKKRKAPKEEDADWDDFEEKPKKKKSSNEEEEEEEPRSSKKKRDPEEEEEEEDKPPKRRQSDEEDEEGDEPKSKKKKDEEDEWEDVAPKSKKKKDEEEDEEEEEPRKKRKSDEEDEEEEGGGRFPRGKRGVRSADEIEEEEAEERSSKKRKHQEED